MSLSIVAASVLSAACSMLTMQQKMKTLSVVHHMTKLAIPIMLIY